MRNEVDVADAGWRIAKVWECAIRDASDAEIALAIAQLADWIRNPRRQRLELRGHR